MSEIRLAVVGVGAFGQNHLRVIRENPRARLVGVVDVDRGRATLAAQANDCAVFQSLEELGGLDVALALPGLYVAVTTLHSSLET